jgi:hypothetical protein
LQTAARCIAGGSFSRTSDGIIVYPDSRFSGHTAAGRLTVINDFDQNHWLFKRNVADTQRDWIGDG